MRLISVVERLIEPQNLPVRSAKRCPCRGGYGLDYVRRFLRLCWGGYWASVGTPIDPAPLYPEVAATLALAVISCRRSVRSRVTHY